MKTTSSKPTQAIGVVKPSVVPRISMNPRHHYVTQSSVWDNPSTGPLTDKKINAYAKEGKYFTTTEKNKVVKKKRHVTMKVKVKKVSALARLLAD